ncbi:hypothetical protein JK629_07475 [Aequorivita iocasae]|uniref:Peptidase M56 domain-containing protein n=1 Tax=Aequorivita iocasae TaxID=2803865 RepID=A0ABX7DVR9_9FLAO|nr:MULTISPECIES: hypothetical protein [Aequorivita]QQX78089.1 hypothetical protein JK629_07475 [Aequorivita iocasae]UCA57598.1 hypothetical protein LDL78_07515 [Aequorivita sp. F7]
MILIVRPKLLRKNYNGITLWPFVVLKHNSLKKDAVFLNHERIHLRQQSELLILFFYLWYGLEFLIRLIQYKNRHKAYRNISFEREAYHYESDFNYLKKRKPYGFLKFL